MNVLRELRAATLARVRVVVDLIKIIPTQAEIPESHQIN